MGASDDGIIDRGRLTDQWFSADLKLQLSRIDASSSSESRIELTNLQRQEPDPKLFEIPPDDTVIYEDRKPSTAAKPETPQPPPTSTRTAPGTP